MTISAKIIADSINPEGVRLTTFELEYPRFCHAEFMTHRLFSRNAQSSRAVPVKKQLEQIRNNPAKPSHWGKNQPGMSAKEECNEPVVIFTYEVITPTSYCPYVPYDRENAWLNARDKAVEVAEAFANAGYHKQIVNRLTEPFAHIKVVCTATEYDNFFWLRRHPDAQPEIQELAERMWEARETSAPNLLTKGDWHLPYYKDGFLRFDPNDHWDDQLADAMCISSSCCAQVSYRTLDTSIEKAHKIYKMLVESKPVHASPFEHQATPIVSIDQRGVTHETFGPQGSPRRGALWSGNFRGWIQHRQLLDDHTNWSYDG